MEIFERPADARTLRWSRAFVAAAAVVFAALVPWATVPLVPVPAFIPVYESAVIITDLVTAVLLFGLFRRSKTRYLWGLSTAYLLGGTVAVLHLLSFPGVFGPQGALGGGSQTTAWLFVFWHSAVPACVLVSALQRTKPSRLKAPVWTSLALVVILAAAAGVMAVSPWMPAVLAGNAMVPLMRVSVGAVAAVAVAALVVVWRRRPVTVLDRWLTAALLAWCMEVALSSFFNAGRYDLGFYSGRVFGLAANSVILWILLLENAAVYGQLEQTNLRLQEADRLKSRFLANMSHEIRTPLNAILGMSSLELRGESSPRRRDALTKIRDAGDTLLRIVNDILDLSKIEAGKLTYETTEFSLEKVMAGIVSMFEAKAAEQGLGFHIHVDSEVPRYLRGDPLRLGQVLNNLVGNALKFTTHGQVDVTVAVRSRNVGRVTLDFTVSDTGMGMDEAAKDSLFSAFSQVDTSISRRFGGTGLGLAITKQLIAGMGGDIEVESEPDQGSVFRFSLAFEINARREDERLVIPETLRGLNSLVVIENPATRARLRAYLESYPFASEYADTGKEGLRLVQLPGAGQYQLVVVDLWLSGVSGYEILRYVKSDPARQPPAVIVVSSLGTKFEHDEAYRQGADAFLVEPVSSSALADAIIRIFGSSPAPLSVKVEDQGTDLNGVRVLVVEDNDVNRQITRELLRSAGMECDAAESGEEAVERLLARPGTYDVVLMDIQMPGMDGYAATRRLRLEPGFAALPIVALSAHAFADEKQESLEAGMNAHVTKPIDPGVLFTAMREVLSKRPAATPAGAAGAGVDTEAGLARVAGNRTLYRRLLAQFAEGWSDTAERFTATWATRDRGQLARLAHNLKGLAGNLGVTGVAEAALALDAALRGAADDDAIATLVQALHTAGTAVEGLLPRAEDSAN
jgi:signal transduction histidine kinase/DNA-binding response OmpR family regulator